MLTVGIILLFIVTSVSPMVVGYTSDDVSSESEELLDNLAFMYYDERDNNAKYEYYKEQLIKEYSNDEVEIVEPVEKMISGELPLPFTTGPMDSPWPMFCHDIRHTGRSQFGASGNTGLEKWKFWMEGLADSSPAIDENGTIYIGSTSNDNKCLYAIYPNGTEKWKFKTNGWVKSSPAIAADGTIYVGSNDGYLYAIYPNGTKKWRFGTGVAEWIYSSPAIDDDGTIYVGSTNYKFYAINPNGTKKWHFQTGYKIYSSAAIDANGIIYFGSHDYYLYALYSNGTMKWRYKTGEEVKSSPAIGDDGIIYVGSWDGYLYAIYPNGTLKWKFNTGDATETSPTIAQDGTICVGSYNGKIFNIDPFGNENWRFQTNDWIISSPAIDKNGVIYVGSLDGTLYALNPDGSLRWKYVTGGSIRPSPAIDENGTIYFAADFTSQPDFYSYLYAIEVIENEPPGKPNIDGPTSGKPRTEYTYIAVTNDPDEDNISYFFDWDDGTNSGWTEFVPSGTPINATHKWWIIGVYNVKVKAKDVYGTESEWGELEVTMPINQQSSHPWFHWFLERFPNMFPILRNLLEAQC